MSVPMSRLGDRQRELVADWLPGARCVADLSWHLVDSYVWRVRTSGGEDVIVKAGSDTNHHFAREIAAYDDSVVAALGDAGLAPRLLAADLEA